MLDYEPTIALHWTKKLFMHRLSLMLKRPNPCKCCPASKEFNDTYPCDEEGCIICNEVMGTYSCPCSQLGEKKAIRKAKKLVKEYYT